MARKDMYNNLDVDIKPHAITADGTVNGDSVDTLGFDAVMFGFKSGTLTDGTHTVSLQESSDNSTWTAVDSSFIQGEAIFALTDDDTKKAVGYIGKERYARYQITSASVTTGGTIYGANVKGHPTSAPVSH